MKFDWSELTESDYDQAVFATFNDECKGEGYYGCVRVGELCIDILVQCPGDGNFLQWDVYVGGEDTGYGYSSREVMATGKYETPYKVPDDELYPYDYADGGAFDKEEIRSLSYDAFKVIAERDFMLFIIRDKQTWEDGATLYSKAHEPLHKW